MHFVRGVIGTLGNICFFWTLTHMLLADAMALQFSRPLFMIPLALLFLGEVAGLRRTAITLVGFAGIALYARPFTAGFDPGAFVGAAGALFGALIVDLHQAAGDDRADPDHHVLLRHQQRGVLADPDDLAVGHAGLVRAGDAGADRLPRHLGPGPDHPRLDAWAT